MPYEAIYLEEHGVVEVINVGRITSSELIAETDAGLKLMRKHGVLRVMVNCLKGEIGFPKADFYWLPKYYDDRGGNRSIRIAVVLPEDEEQRAGYSLYEDAARNRAYSAKLFETRDEAIAWLISP